MMKAESRRTAGVPTTGQAEKRVPSDASTDRPSSIPVRAVLSAPFEQVDYLLRKGPEEWLPGYAPGQSHTIMRATRFGQPFEMHAAVTVGAAVRHEGRSRVPIVLKPSEHQNRYPTFRGWLEATALPRRRTRLTIHLTYTPPGGGLGEVIDHSLMAGVARQLVQDFLAEVSAVVLRAVRSQQLATAV